MSVEDFGERVARRMLAREIAERYVAEKVASGALVRLPNGYLYKADSPVALEWLLTQDSGGAP